MIVQCILQHQHELLLMGSKKTDDPKGLYMISKSHSKVDTSTAQERATQLANDIQHVLETILL